MYIKDIVHLLYMMTVVSAARDNSFHARHCRSIDRERTTRFVWIDDH